MPRPARIALIAGAVIALAAGGFGAARWLRTPQAASTPIPVAPARQRLAREVPELPFTDVTKTSGVAFTHEAGYSGTKLLPETMGGGVAVFDYDSDGKPDILLVNGRTWPGHGKPHATPHLYRNLGNMKFEDVTAKSGLNVSVYGMGVTVGDIDNDGRPDLFLSCVGQNRLFRNVDGKRFEDITQTAGVGGATALPDVGKQEFADWKPPIPFGSSCTFLDYDGDGKLDLFVCHYVTWSPAIDRSIASSVVGGKRTFAQPRDFDGSLCTLYRNVDGKRFEDVSQAAGVTVTQKEGTDANAPRRPVGKSLGVVACDADGDGWPDVIVANDTVRNFFFHNVAGPDGKRTFAEIGHSIGAAYADEGRPRGGMGVDWCEFAPGRGAAVIANFANEPLTLLEKDKTRLAFSDSALSTGLSGPSRATLKFGTLFFDADNDGRPDLFVCNGHIEPDIAAIQSSQEHAQSPQLYWNTGDSECYYELVPESRTGPDLVKPLVGRGCAVGDFDGDGDLDLVLVANGGPARVLRNDAALTNHSVRLDPRGDGTHANRSAIGAEVTIEAGGQTIARQVIAARGYLSQSERVLTVGIGPATRADAVTIRWPGSQGKAETWKKLGAGRTHVLRQGESQSLRMQN